VELIGVPVAYDPVTKFCKTVTPSDATSWTFAQNLTSCAPEREAYSQTFQFPPTTVVTPGTPTFVTNVAISVPEVEFTDVVIIDCVPTFGVINKFPDTGLVPLGLSKYNTRPEDIPGVPCGPCGP